MDGISTTVLVSPGNVLRLSVLGSDGKVLCETFLSGPLRLVGDVPVVQSVPVAGAHESPTAPRLSVVPADRVSRVAKARRKPKVPAPAPVVGLSDRVRAEKARIVAPPDQEEP